MFCRDNGNLVEPVLGAAYKLEETERAHTLAHLLPTFSPSPPPQFFGCNFQPPFRLEFFFLKSSLTSCRCPFYTLQVLFQRRSLPWKSLRGVGIYIIRLGDGISPGLWRTGPVGPFSKSAIHGSSCTSKRLHLQAEHRGSPSLLDLRYSLQPPRLYQPALATVDRENT